MIRLANGRFLHLLRVIITTALILAGIWLTFRYLLPWTLPLLLAFLTATLIQPVINLFVSKFAVSRGFASTACSLMALVIMITIISLIIIRLIYEASSLTQRLPHILSSAAELLESVMKKAGTYINSAPDGIRGFLNSALDSAASAISSFSERTAGFIIDTFSSVASAFPRIFLALATYVIGVFFISSSYEDIKSFIMKQIPPRFHQRVRLIRGDMRSTLGNWLKAQLKIIGITFLELTIGFSLMKIPYSVLLAAIVALIDALPVLGTGTVLIPWAIIELIAGNGRRAIFIAVIYGVVTIVRSFIEPRIIGRQIGLHPAAMLCAMYIGFCALGIAGMIFLPIILVLLKQFNDKGYIRLWKN